MDTKQIHYFDNTGSMFTYNITDTIDGKLPYQPHRLYEKWNDEFICNRTVGDKTYEIKDHLGNVRVLVSDLKTTADTVDVKGYNDYYPFGMIQPGRNFNSQDYRFGFNGKEYDPEWTGNTGVTYDYGFRIYDARINRFLSVDPLYKSYPWYTPYQFAGNTPIMAIDLDGLEEFKVIKHPRYPTKDPFIEVPNQQGIALEFYDKVKMVIAQAVLSKLIEDPLVSIDVEDPEYTDIAKIQAMYEIIEMDISTMVTLEPYETSPLKEAQFEYLIKSKDIRYKGQSIKESKQEKIKEATKEGGEFVAGHAVKYVLKKLFGKVAGGIIGGLLRSEELGKEPLKEEKDIIKGKTSEILKELFTD